MLTVSVEERLRQHSQHLCRVKTFSRIILTLSSTEHSKGLSHEIEFKYFDKKYVILDLNKSLY
jgi:hypothetical protein